jgi:serine/threonine protein kinase
MDRWKQIEQLYFEARGHAPAEREEFLRAACQGDEDLFKEVSSLLDTLPEVGDFLEKPAQGEAAGEPAQAQNESSSGGGALGQKQDQPLAGRRLGPYEILSLLGRGGMGDVYRARDTRLDRQVAIKVLPEAFTGDPVRLARFEREAKLLASLNHPNIAAIYGLEEADGKLFLVLELVEGETLAEWLSRGPLPMEMALGVCRQIAEGVEAAHERGIIHRDLKPGNVKITPEGKVKILDFGLAKAYQKEGSLPDLSRSPTLTDEMTRPGVILGTAAYMSPEQAKGKPVDKRADIWAFGCVLFECLTGEGAFQGETIT